MEYFRKTKEDFWVDEFSGGTNMYDVRSDDPGSLIMGILAFSVILSTEHIMAMIPPQFLSLDSSKKKGITHSY